MAIPIGALAGFATGFGRQYIASLSSPGRPGQQYSPAMETPFRSVYGPGFRPVASRPRIAFATPGIPNAVIGRTRTSRNLKLFNTEGNFPGGVTYKRKHAPARVKKRAAALRKKELQSEIRDSELQTVTGTTTRTITLAPAVNNSSFAVGSVYVDGLGTFNSTVNYTPSTTIAPPHSLEFNLATGSQNFWNRLVYNNANLGTLANAGGVDPSGGTSTASYLNASGFPGTKWLNMSCGAKYTISNTGQNAEFGKPLRLSIAVLKPRRTIKMEENDEAASVDVSLISNLFLTSGEFSTSRSAGGVTSLRPNFGSSGPGIPYIASNTASLISPGDFGWTPFNCHYLCKYYDIEKFEEYTIKFGDTMEWEYEMKRHKATWRKWEDMLDLHATPGSTRQILFRFEKPYGSVNSSGIAAENIATIAKESWATWKVENNDVKRTQWLQPPTTITANTPFQ